MFAIGERLLSQHEKCIGRVGGRKSIWRSARNLEGGGRDDAESMSRIISGVLSIYSLWGEDENKISTREREMKWTFENIPIPLSLRGGQALRNRVGFSRRLVQITAATYHFKLTVELGTQTYLLNLPTLCRQRHFNTLLQDSNHAQDTCLSQIALSAEPESTSSLCFDIRLFPFVTYPHWSLRLCLCRLCWSTHCLLFRLALCYSSLCPYARSALRSRP